jgi:hypothetical protein
MAILTETARTVNRKERHAMKTESRILTGIATLAIVAAGLALAANQHKAPNLLHFENVKRTTGHWTTDSQVAAGEWKIEVQTPPCDDPKNLQVVWSPRSGEPTTIECGSMPVAER